MSPGEEFFILIASPVFTGLEHFSSTEIVKERLSRGFWPLGASTRHRESFKPNDRAIFYAAGVGQMVFTATARISSTCITIGRKEGMLLEDKFEFVNAFPFGISLEEPQYFKRPVPARELLKELSFIGNSSKWGAYFQGGVIRITEDDYKLIVARGNL